MDMKQKFQIHDLVPEMHSSHHSRNNEVHFTYSGGQQNNCRGETIKSTSHVFSQMVMGRSAFLFSWCLRIWTQMASISFLCCRWAVPRRIHLAPSNPLIPGHSQQKKGRHTKENIFHITTAVPTQTLQHSTDHDVNLKLNTYLEDCWKPVYERRVCSMNSNYQPFKSLIRLTN